MTNKIITDEQIARLMTEAGEAGDLAQVELCESALRGDATARALCETAIRDAEAQS
jgi:hypothetical protein